MALWGILDGYHRAKICEELGLEYPKNVRPGMTEDEKFDFALRMNLHRRHLTREQRQELSLKLRQKGWSYPRIAETLGVSHPTVIEDLRTCRNLQVDLPTRTIGKDGKERPAVNPVKVEQYTKAVEDFPELKVLPMNHVIDAAKQLNTLPPEARPEVVRTITTKVETEKGNKESEEFQRAMRIKEGMRRLIERLHIFSQNPPATYFEGMDKVDLAFEEAFWWNNLKIIDGALEWLTEFRKEYAKRFGEQKGIRRIK